MTVRQEEHARGPTSFAGLQQIVKSASGTAASKGLLNILEAKPLDHANRLDDVDVHQAVQMPAVFAHFNQKKMH